MANTQIDGGRQIKSATITDDRHVESYIKANGTRAFTGNQALGGFKFTGSGDATADSDIPSWGQVKLFTTSKDWKDPVDVATTAAGTLATSFENGDVIDDITLVTGMSLLIKDQVTGSENGIYLVNASGSPTRRTDADISAEVTHNMTMNVLSGTVNGGLLYSLTTADPIVLGTTALTFSNTGGGTTGTNAGAGLTKTGNTIDAIAGDVSILVNANEFHVQRDDASLELGAGGIRVVHGTGGQVYIANSSGVLTPVSLTGDVSTVSNTGLVTLTTGTGGVMKNANHIVRETPSGSVNGSNAVFTLANTPLSGKEEVFLNGLLQEPGGEDYTISSATITFVSAPSTGDRIRVSYDK